MTRAQAIHKAYKEHLLTEGNPSNGFEYGARWADAHPINPWHKVSEALPKVDTEVVCKMKGVPHTEHFICKWDGKYWWRWNDCGRGIKGWFGLNTEWEVVEWKEIQED